MATNENAAVPEFTDLFGNSTLTPAQVIQQQQQQRVAQAGQGAQVRGGNIGASQAGAGVGGLLRQILMDQGLMPKDPTQERAEKMVVARGAIDKEVKEKGVDIASDPEAYAALAARHFLKAGMEQESFKAVQMGAVLHARKRAADMDAAKLSGIKAETEKTLAITAALRTKALQGPVLEEAKVALLKDQAKLAQARTKLLDFTRTSKASDPKRGQAAIVLKLLETAGTRPLNARERDQFDRAVKAPWLQSLMGMMLGAGGVPATPLEDTEETEILDLSGGQ